jgi:hypothetical protein
MLASSMYVVEESLFDPESVTVVDASFPFPGMATHVPSALQAPLAQSAPTLHCLAASLEHAPQTSAPIAIVANAKTRPSWSEFLRI